MPIINKGTAFSNGEQLTADKINNLLDLATFNQSATDSVSTTVNSASQIVVADSGITTAKLAADAVETAKIKDANVTKAKIEDVADYKVLGNVSGAAAAPAEVAILDEDDMVSNSATALATQQSIKTYVDASAQTFVPASYAGEESVTLPNGLIMKFGFLTGVTTTGKTFSFSSAFPTAVISATATGNTTNTITISSNYAGKCAVSNVTTSGMKVWGEPGSSAYWTVIGY
jgi:hypothetical protein